MAAVFKNIISQMRKRFVGSSEIKASIGSKKKEVYSKIISSVTKERFSEPGISELAMVADTAKIAETATVSAGAYIGAHVKIGDRTRIYPNVTILDDTVIGNDVVISSGSVIGGEGYGFYLENNGNIIHVPQISKVIIKDDVYIGSNASICRGSKRNTVIGKGTKINSNIHIAHNVKVGENCLIMSNVSISGSTVIGNNVSINPMATIAKHIKIGDNVIIGMNSTVIRDVRPNTRVIGSPAKEK